uniref:Uncharacterized protein n=1 Tax=Maylandia zebra TaxID=106582 RepID=A0A3P9DIG8_9CICH
MLPFPRGGGKQIVPGSAAVGRPIGQPTSPPSPPAPMVTALGLSVAFILKFRDNMFHVLTGQFTTVLVTGTHGPAGHLYLHASWPKDLEYSLQREKLRVINGEVFERSRGDSEELELLTKVNADSVSDEESL